MYGYGFGWGQGGQDFPEDWESMDELTRQQWLMQNHPRLMGMAGRGMGEYGQRFGQMNQNPFDMQRIRQYIQQMRGGVPATPPTLPPAMTPPQASPAMMPPTTGGWQLPPGIPQQFGGQAPQNPYSQYSQRALGPSVRDTMPQRQDILNRLRGG